MDKALGKAESSQTLIILKIKLENYWSFVQESRLLQIQMSETDECYADEAWKFRVRTTKNLRKNENM